MHNFSNEKDIYIEERCCQTLNIDHTGSILYFPKQTPQCIHMLMDISHSYSQTEWVTSSHNTAVHNILKSQTKICSIRCWMEHDNTVQIYRANSYVRKQNQSGVNSPVLYISCFSFYHLVPLSLLYIILFLPKYEVLFSIMHETITFPMFPSFNFEPIFIAFMFFTSFTIHFD